MHVDDQTLLQAYARDGAHAAFAALVQRHVNLVYSAARRQVRSHDFAQEITQLVFIALARKAHRIGPDTPLAAWLYLVTRRTALDLLRREARRRAREQAAAREFSAMKPSPDWPAIEPWLDEAMATLGQADGSALLLRFFENKSLREVGEALGISEDAAQKRVSRALDQLRAAFGRKGLALTTAGLATQLSAHAIVAAPAGLEAAVSSATLVAAGTTASGGWGTLAMTTLHKNALVASLAVAAGTVFYQGVGFRSQSFQNGDLADAVLIRRDGLARLRAEGEAAARRLAGVEREIDVRLAAAGGSESPADAALREQIETWLEKLDRMHRFLAARPELATPEMKLLSEEQWLSTARSSPLESEADIRKALAGLRSSGVHMTAYPLRRALEAYLKAHDDRLPTAPAQLAPYLPPHFDTSLLARYEMLATGKASEFSAPAAGVMAMTVVADLEYDGGAVWIGVSDYGTMKFAPQAIAQARADFAVDHGGRAPVHSGEFAPYLELPLPAHYVRKKLRAAIAGVPR